MANQQTTHMGTSFPFAARHDTSSVPGIILDDMTYSERLFHYSCSVEGLEPHFLAFRGLQRINLVHLQNKLAKHKGNVWKEKAAPEDTLEDLEVILHKYGKSFAPGIEDQSLLTTANAIRDYAYFGAL